MNTQSDKSDVEAGEKISSFIDGEIPKDHCDKLIVSICKDEMMKACLDRYQLISDTIRRKLPQGVNRGFVHSVMAAIDTEPTVLTPPRRSSSRTLFPSSFSKKVAGFAIAASVATIAVVGVQVKNQEQPPQQVATMPQSSEFDRLPKDAPVVASENRQQIVVPQASSGFSTASSVLSQQELIPQDKLSEHALAQKEAMQNLQAQLLHQYVLDHSQYASGSGVYDVIPHSRIVASTQQQNYIDQGQK